MSTHATEGNGPANPTHMVEETPGPSRDRWHRDHPTFTALAGFFTGLMFVTVVPGGFAGLLRLLFDFDTAERLFPIVAIALVVPVALVANRRTRRFGTYMIIGMVLTALVVLGVTSLVLYYMVRRQQG
jgi:asparagine N-glycosylation enzyme membrane subunit Stt3